MRAKADLRAAQQRTVTRLYEEDAVQAVLPMGAGKTAAALTAFQELKEDSLAQDMFVLAPKRVALMVWPAEPRQWEHLRGLRVLPVTGSAAQRERTLHQPADIYAIGIENAQWFVEWAERQPAGRFKRSVFCIDELSRFKNPRGKRARALFKIIDRFLCRWGLTGTPRPNGYEDQFNPMKLLTLGKLWGKSFDRWREQFFYPLDYNAYKWAVRPEAEPKIVEAINIVSITIGPDDMPDVPALNDGPEFIEWVELPHDVKPVYDRMQKKLVAELKAGTIAAANMAVASGKLCQIAQGFLYESFEDERKGRSAERLHDVKMERLLEMIEEAGGEPVMIAYDFQEDLARLQEEFPGLPYLGRGDRQDIEFERAWNDGRMAIGAVHWASAGHGLNLQFGGSQLFPYNLTWSAELYDQLVKRFHRPGQTHPVWVRPILVRGTVDEVKYARVKLKMSNQEAFRLLLKEV